MLTRANNLCNWSCDYSINSMSRHAIIKHFRFIFLCFMMKQNKLIQLSKTSVQE